MRDFPSPTHWVLRERDLNQIETNFCHKHPMPYTTLDPDKIIKTADILESRVQERFPNASLVGVSTELKAIAKDAKERAKELSEPIQWLRVATFASVFLGVIIFFFIGTFLNFDRIATGAFDFVQGVEATINAVVLAGLGFLTIAKSEERIKRRKVLDGLHGLRSVIHIIDMHQLTKDPVSMRADFKPTPSSPERKLTPNELVRYLDYCSEMLSITGKVAALYAQAVPDMEVVNAVNDVEALGGSMSRKVWQKIMLIESEKAPNAPTRPTKSKAKTQ